MREGAQGGNSDYPLNATALGGYHSSLLHNFVNGPISDYASNNPSILSQHYKPASSQNLMNQSASGLTLITGPSPGLRN